MADTIICDYCDRHHDRATISEDDCLLVEVAAEERELWNTLFALERLREAFAEARSAVGMLAHRPVDDSSAASEQSRKQLDTALEQFAPFDLALQSAEAQVGWQRGRVQRETQSLESTVRQQRAKFEKPAKKDSADA